MTITWIELAILAYLMINSFTTGWTFANSDILTPTTFMDGLLGGAALAGGVLFSMPILLLSLVYKFWVYVGNTFQVRSMLKFHLTKRFDNMKIADLYRINSVAINHRNTSQFKDRIFRRCVRLINKRNNYVHNQSGQNL